MAFQTIILPLQQMDLTMHVGFLHCYFWERAPLNASYVKSSYE